MTKPKQKLKLDSLLDVMGILVDAYENDLIQVLDGPGIEKSGLPTKLKARLRSGFNNLDRAFVEMQILLDEVNDYQEDNEND